MFPILLSSCRGDPCGRPVCRSYLFGNAIANADDHKGRPYNLTNSAPTDLRAGLLHAGTRSGGTGYQVVGNLPGKEQVPA